MGARKVELPWSQTETPDDRDARLRAAQNPAPWQGPEQGAPTPTGPHNTSPDFAPGTEVHRRILDNPWDDPGLAVTPRVTGNMFSGEDQIQTPGTATPGYPWLDTNLQRDDGFFNPSFFDSGARRPAAPKRRASPTKKIEEAKTVEVLDPRPAKPKRDFTIPNNGPRVVRINEWRDRLLPASFRGIPFEVETYAMTIGRRTAVYEYPQRDLPSAQDFGLATKDISFTAFVLGDDYDLQRNNLIQALEFPGPGELVHPYYGRLTCNVTTPCRVSEEAVEYRVAKFDLNFVAVSDVPTTPVVAVNTVAAAQAASDAMTSQAKTRLGILGPLMAAKKAQESASFLQHVSNTAKAVVDFYGVVRSGWDKDFEALMSTTNALTGFRNVAETEIQRLFGDVKSLKLLLTWLYEGGPFQDLFADDKQTEASKAIEEWVDCAVLNQCVDLLLASDWDSYEELYRTAGEVADAIHALEADTDSPEMYQAFSALRITLSQMIWSFGQLLPRERSLDFVGFMPAVVLSHGVYGTPLRDDEIARRNGVVHPSFVISPVVVLSS